MSFEMIKSYQYLNRNNILNYCIVMKKVFILNKLNHFEALNNNQYFATRGHFGLSL